MQNSWRKWKNPLNETLKVFKVLVTFLLKSIQKGETKVCSIHTILHKRKDRMSDGFCTEKNSFFTALYPLSFLRKPEECDGRKSRNEEWNEVCAGRAPLIYCLVVLSEPTAL